MQPQRIQFVGTGAAVFVLMAALAPSANGQTVTSSRNPAGSMSVGMLRPEHQRVATIPLKIRDWPLAVRVGDAPARVAASHAASSTRMTRQRSPGTRVAQRVTAGVAMGILGFFAGGLAGAGVGAAVDREYGPLSGFLVGGVVGAGAGAAIGVLIVR